MPLYTQTECKYQPQHCRGPRQADAPKAPPRDRNQGQGSGRTQLTCFNEFYIRRLN